MAESDVVHLHACMVEEQMLLLLSECCLDRKTGFFFLGG